VQDREPATTVNSRLGLAGTIAAAVVVLDQATKSWAVRELAYRDIHVLWTLDLRLTFNDGAAFGIGSGRSTFFIIAGVVVLALVFAMARQFRGPLSAAALGLVIGGAAGNLIDRLFRDADGAVVDFIDLGWWPTFNVADAAITVGAVLLVLSGREPRAA
jgi:signal peptidase II